MTLSVDILERVRRLVALASSPEPEEARTAAHKACALIREHELRLELPVGGRAPTPRSRAPARPASERFRTFGWAYVFRFHADQAAHCRRCGDRPASLDFVRTVDGDPGYIVHDRCLKPDDHVRNT